MAIPLRVAEHLKEIVREGHDEDEPTTLADDGATGSLGPYDVQAVLGAGGMGTVYRAVDRATGKPVAIKVPHAGSFPFTSRFAREAWLAQSLGQIGDTPYLEHGVTSIGTPFLAMPLLEGSALSRLLSERGALAPDEVLRIGERVAHVLGRLHGRGDIHRDIKPDNIMVDERGSVWVMDLGLTGSPATVPRGVGTPAYAPPEQMTGRPIQPDADVYALAVSLVEASTGDLTTPSYDESAQIDAALRRIGPVELRDLLRRMLSTDPAARPKDGAAVARALARIRTIGRLADAAHRHRGEGLWPATPFVGRDTELAALRARLDATRRVRLTGPAGMGKSRLVFEWWRAHASDEAMLLWPTRSRQGPGALARAWLEAAAGLRGHETAPEQMQAVDELVRDVATAPTAEALQRAPESEQGQKALSTVLESLAAERPLVMVCSASAPADEQSLELAARMQKRTKKMWLVELAERPRSEDLTLGPLSPRAQLTICEAIAPAGRADRALAGAYGSPLALQLLLVEPAETLAASIGAWLDRFDPYARWIARLASLAGPCFRAEQILDVAGACDGPAVRDALERLADARMLVDLTRETGAPAGCYRFRHHLLADVARSVWSASEVAWGEKRLAEP